MYVEKLWVFGRMICWHLEDVFEGVTLQRLTANPPDVYLEIFFANLWFWYCPSLWVKVFKHAHVFLRVVKFCGMNVEKSDHRQQRQRWSTSQEKTQRACCPFQSCAGSWLFAPIFEKGCTTICQNKFLLKMTRRKLNQTYQTNLLPLLQTDHWCHIVMWVFMKAIKCLLFKVVSWQSSIVLFLRWQIGNKYITQITGISCLKRKDIW